MSATANAPGATGNRERYLGLLVLGQSNAGCHGPTPGNCADPRCAVVFENRRQLIADPLPGTTGSGGSIWPRVAARLMASGAVDRFTVRLAAIAGARMADLAPGGQFHPMVASVLAHAANGDVPVTHVLIHQGEADTRFNTAGAAYRASFLALEKAIRDRGIEAPVILCRASWRFGVRNPEVHAMQTELGAGPGRIAGPDTDLLENDMRVDGTHFSEAGQDAFAARLVETCLPLIPMRGAGPETPARARR